MPDKQGRVLVVGDKVNIPCIVRDVLAVPDPDGTDLVLLTVEKTPGGLNTAERSIIVINSKQVVRD